MRKDQNIMNKEKQDLITQKKQFLEKKNMKLKTQWTDKA